MRESTFSAEFAACIGPVARELLGEPNKALSSRDEWRYGERGSLKIDVTKGTFFDFESGESGGVINFVKWQKQADKDTALEWLRTRNHLPEKSSNTTNTKRRIIATYDYVNEAGVPLFQVRRMEPKDFRQAAADGHGGWIYAKDCMKGVRRVPYHLPNVIAAVANRETIYIAEGEKGVHAVESLGLVATCSPGGAGKWRKAYNDHFAGADVVVLPDHDPQAEKNGVPQCHPDGRPVLPGQDHAADVAQHLVGIASRVRVLMLPGLPLKGDVHDWVQAGGTAAQLEELAAQCEPEKAAEKPLPNGKDDHAATDDAAILADDGGFVTEDSVARAFAEERRDELRFDHHAGAWYRWDGWVWRKEETKLAFSWARHIARRVAKGSGNDKAIATAGKASFAAGVERFTQADRAFAVTSAIWDADPWLLSTPGGTVDLRTGKIRPAQQADYITKQTAVAPAETADCPVWLAFLKEATKDDDALIGFLRRWFGYTLTGITKEHALLFVFGDGGNGKGVCLVTIAGIMGDYAVNAAMDAFTATTGDRHPTDMAMLAGARMVLTTETEEGQYWAEARLKALTGGDPITARFMRKDFFTFVPAFKLTVSGNHKPALRNVDAAARRRFNLAPFLYRPAVPDKDLPEKLKAEWPGILRWMIDGCLEWQRDGLQQPDVVKLATEAYFSEQDTVHQWVEDCCETGRDKFETKDVLFKSWTDYALANGEKPGSAKWFSQTLAKLECEATKHTPGQNGKRGYLGIAVKTIKPTDWTASRGTDDRDEPPF